MLLNVEAYGKEPSDLQPLKKEWRAVRTNMDAVSTHFQSRDALSCKESVLGICIAGMGALKVGIKGPKLILGKTSRRGFRFLEPITLRSASAAKPTL